MEYTIITRSSEGWRVRGTYNRTGAKSALREYRTTGPARVVAHSRPLEDLTVYRYTAGGDLVQFSDGTEAYWAD